MVNRITLRVQKYICTEYMTKDTVLVDEETMDKSINSFTKIILPKKGNFKFPTKSLY